jgi:hypothetical protein
MKTAMTGPPSFAKNANATADLDTTSIFALHAGAATTA